MKEQLGKEPKELGVTWPDSSAQLCLGRGVLETLGAIEAPSFPGSTAETVLGRVSTSMALGMLEDSALM